MFTFLSRAALVFALALAAPVASAAITPAQQRVAIHDALDVFIAEIQTEIDTANAQLASSTPGSFEADQLQRQILILSGRQRLAQSVQLQLAYLPDVTLNDLIIRFDLPVSLS